MTVKKIGVLLFHGMAGTPAELRYVANQLTQRGYHVVTPTIGGLACGSDRYNLATWRDWMTGVRRAHDAIRKDCDIVYVGGLSAGATLALKLAAERPSGVSGLLLLAPTLAVNGWAIPWTMKLFSLVVQRPVARLFNFCEREPFGIKDARVRAMAIEGLKRDFQTTDVDAFRVNGVVVLELRRLAAALRRDMKHVVQPALIIHPREDDQANLNNSLYIQRHVSGPVETVVLDDSYHVVTLDKQRQIVVESIDRFVRQRSKQAKQAYTTEPGDLHRVLAEVDVVSAAQ